MKETGREVQGLMGMTDMTAERIGMAGDEVFLEIVTRGVITPRKGTESTVTLTECMEDEITQGTGTRNDTKDEMTPKIDTGGVASIVTLKMRNANTNPRRTTARRKIKGRIRRWPPPP
jgi:hypothetical protein